MQAGHGNLLVEDGGEVELLEDAAARGRGHDEQAVALGRDGADEGAEGLEDGVGHAGADGVPFDEAFDVVAGG